MTFFERIHSLDSGHVGYKKLWQEYVLCVFAWMGCYVFRLYHTVIQHCANKLSFRSDNYSFVCLFLV